MAESFGSNIRRMTFQFHPILVPSVSAACAYFGADLPLTHAFAVAVSTEVAATMAWNAGNLILNTTEDFKNISKHTQSIYENVNTQRNANNTENMKEESCTIVLNACEAAPMKSSLKKGLTKMAFSYVAGFGVATAMHVSMVDFLTPTLQDVEVTTQPEYIMMQN